MERVRTLAKLRRKRQAETVEPHRSTFRGFEGRRRVDALVVAAALASQEKNGVGRNLGMVQQVILPADAGQLRLLLLLGHPRHVVWILAVDSDQIRLRDVRERRLREELRPRDAPVSGDDAVFAEVLLVEEGRCAKTLQRTASVEFAVALDFDAELFDQPLGGVAVRKRRRDALCATVADERTSVVVELVTLGVTAEVVVVIENENLLIVPERTPPEVRRRQAGNPGADDDQIVFLAAVGACRHLSIGPLLQRGESVDRRGIVAAQAGAERRILSRIRRSSARARLRCEGVCC